MKARVCLTFVVDTNDYTDVNTMGDVHHLVHDMLLQEADLPEYIEIAIGAQGEHFGRDPELENPER